jgi:hypothetical protein
MTDLSSRYLGLSLPTPLVVSASPLSRDVAQIGKMAYLGPGPWSCSPSLRNS